VLRRFFGSHRRRLKRRDQITLIAAAMLATALAARAEDPFQSAPGPPEPPRPRAPQRTPPPREAAPATPAPVNADRSDSAHAPSGVAARVSFAGWFDDNCVASPMEIRIVEPPNSGTATIRDETETIPANSKFRPTPPACVGVRRTVKSIYYQSNPGFRGADRLGYSVGLGGGQLKRVEVQISVE
jgi:hypothetical protein